MKNISLFILVGMLIVSSHAFSQDMIIDSSGNVGIGETNPTAKLDVFTIVGDAIVGESSSGYAGYFLGNTKVTGDLIVDGTLTGETDPTVNAGVKDGVDWTELSGIPVGFADGTDDTEGSGIWSQNGLDIYYNSGNIGIGTSAPAGKLDVDGNICLGSICRTTWPTGSGTGAFNDTGTAAYYNGGNVGIGTTSPQGLQDVESKVLHMIHPSAVSGDTAVGLRLQIDSPIDVDAGVMSAYDATSGDGGLFVGTLSNHRVGIGTNGTRQLTVQRDGTVDIKGNVGIGTSSPIQALHVQGNTYIFDNLGVGIDSPTNKLEVSGNSALLSSGTGDFRLNLSKNSTTASSSLIFQDNFIGYTELGLTGDNNFHIKMSPDGTLFTDAMMIDPTGNIGVGTVPAARLHVVSNALISLWAENSGNILPAIVGIKNGSGDAMWITHDSSSGNAVVITQNGADPAMIIRNSSSDIVVVDSAGNVGIGISTPQSSLQVSGYAQLALSSGVPPAADCDDPLELGRMKVDNAAGLLYICVDSGWIAK